MFGKNNNLIEITDEASVRLRTLLDKKGKSGIRLRLVSNGCASYVYDMDFGTKRIGNEVEVDSKGIKFFIAKKSLDYLRGLKVKYDIEKEGFVFDNPNVKKGFVSQVS